MNLFRRIVALILLPLMLFSSIGFSLDVHFCKGEVKSIGVFNASPCEMMSGSNETLEDDSDLPPCHRKKMGCEKMTAESRGDLRLEEGPCCHNERFSSVLDSKLESNPTELNSTAVTPIITAILMTRFWSFYTVNKERIFSYKPPPRVYNLPVLLQVFRI